MVECDVCGFDVDEEDARVTFCVAGPVTGCAWSFVVCPGCDDSARADGGLVCGCCSPAYGAWLREQAKKAPDSSAQGLVGVVSQVPESRRRERDGS